MPVIVVFASLVYYESFAMMFRAACLLARYKPCNRDILPYFDTIYVVVNLNASTVFRSFLQASSDLLLSSPGPFSASGT
jgi:hypothetical protein